MYKAKNKGIRKTIYVKFEKIKFYDKFISRLKKDGISLCDYLFDKESKNEEIKNSDN